MQLQNKQLVYVVIKKAALLKKDKKVTQSILRIMLDGQLHEHEIEFTNNEQQINEVHLFRCQKDSVLKMFYQCQNESKNAFVQIKLNQLSAKPKVLHVMQAQLAQMVESEVKEPHINLIKVDLDIIFLPQIKGRLVIDAMYLNLDIQNDLKNQSEYFVELLLEYQAHKNAVKLNQDHKGRWREPQKFLVQDLANNGILKLRVWDKGPISSSQIGGCDVDLLQQNFCIPLKKSTSKYFTLRCNSQDKGKIKLEYNFEFLKI